MVPKWMAVAAVCSDEWWNSVLHEFETGRRSGQRFETGGKNLRLCDIRRGVLRVECLRCFRIVEIQRLDAVKLCDAGSVWKEVGTHLLESGCAPNWLPRRRRLLAEVLVNAAWSAGESVEENT